MRDSIEYILEMAEFFLQGRIAEGLSRTRMTEASSVVYYDSNQQTYLETVSVPSNVAQIVMTTVPIDHYTSRQQVFSGVIITF